MTQEILRILLRCSKNLEWKVVAGHCSEFNKRMQYSGYNHKFRSMVTSSAINAYKKIRERDEDGSTPMYRKKEWNRIQREARKRKKRENWFNNKGEESVIFVPVTPRSELRNTMQEIASNTGILIQKCRKDTREHTSEVQPIPKYNM